MLIYEQRIDKIIGGGMFGHSDNNQQFGDNQQVQGDPGVSAQPQDQPQAAPQADDQVMQNGSLEESSTMFGTSPVNTDAPAEPVSAPAPTPTSPVSSPSAPADNPDLLAIKQQALQDLSPLVSHLEQSAEEKFKTTMMMIQASDDQTLLHAAYEAAQGITDDKARAQALLDIVNEINYFTQAHNS